MDNTMFLMRSIFWLLVAYAVIRPGMDIDPRAAANQALVAGHQLVSEQVDAIQCDSLQCTASKAVFAAAIPDLPSVGPTMHDSPTVKDVPYPMPRLRRAG